MSEIASTMDAIISPSAIKRLHGGHRWIYANEFVTPVITLPTGGIVHLISPRQEHIGFAHTNPHSLLAGRILTTSKTLPDVIWLKQRLNTAALYRERIGFGKVCRLVYAEADSLPGLTIDRYDTSFVIQVVTAGMESWKPQIIGWLKEKFTVESIILRNDTPYRSQENLSTENENVLGEAPDRYTWLEHGVLNCADLRNGQKTGAFLDQRMNRFELDEISKDCTVLDLFCHNGGFGLRAAVTGAKKVLFVDASQSSLDITKEAAKENGVENKCEFVKADIFEWLQKQTDVFDIVVCDPPSLIKNRTSVAAGERGYANLNRRAMKLVSPGGTLFTFSCSHLLSRARFREVLHDAARDETWILIKELMQSTDHPILLGHPETEYLKGAVLKKTTVC